MLVDDEPQVRAVLAAGLAEHSHVVIELGDARAALERLDAADLLVTDLAMPGLDGLEFIRAARVQRPGLAALLITGHTGDVSSVLLRQTADDDPFGVVHKPIMPDEHADRADAMMAAAPIIQG